MTSDKKQSPRHFADKLRLIMRVTGCETQKALFSRLKSVNPDTGYDPVRAYKWVQGRSSPRNKAVYDDLAMLLDLDIGGEWLRTCSYTAFHARLVNRFGAKVPPLHREQSNPQSSHGQEIAAESLALPGYLAGRYLSVSRSWTPHRPGTLITGITTVSDGIADAAEIEYVEHLPWGELRLSGTVRRVGRNVSAPLRSGGSEMTINFTYALPPAPGAVLAGVMSGVTLSDAEMRPVACRVLGLRLPEAAGPDPEISGYLEPEQPELETRLVACGFSATQAADFAPDILDFLMAPGDRGVIEAPMTMVNALIGKVLG